MMSTRSAFVPANPSTLQPFRGGVPGVFPSLAGKADDPKAPGHGLVRTVTWSVESTREDAGDVILTLLTKSDAATKQCFPGDFELREVVTMGKELTIEIQAKNTRPAPMHFEQALHTYFAVKDVQQVQVLGLDGATYSTSSTLANKKLSPAPRHDRPPRRNRDHVHARRIAH